MSRCHHCGLDHPMDGPTCPLTEAPLRDAGPCGKTIDRYEVERWLGGGGFGAVYRARHVVMDRTVALKLLHGRLGATTRAVERFFQEAKAAAAIGHPNIVQVFDAGTASDGTAFLAMELVRGCSLHDLAEVDRLPARRAIDIVLQVLDALGAAHRAGIVHRDVKPGNIMLAGTDPAGGSADDRVKLVDFGISKVRKLDADESLTRSNMSMGSPGYAAPEQYVSARDVDPRADVYGVGVVLYRLLTGELPFDADSYEQMVLRVCTSDPAPLATRLPDVSPALAAAVDRAIARDRDARHESAEAFAAALRGTHPKADTLQSVPAAMAIAPTIATHGSGAYGAVGGVPPTRTVDERPRRARWVWAIAGLGVLALVVAAAFALIPASRPEVADPPAPVTSPPEPHESDPAAEVPVLAPTAEPELEPEPASAAPVAEPLEQPRARARRRARRMSEPAMEEPAAAAAPAPTPMETTTMRAGFGTEDLEPF